MAKKNMDILLGNILGKAAIHPQDRFDRSPGNPQEEQKLCSQLSDRERFA